MADDTFDVFLSHNSKDKPVVRQIAEALRDGRRLKVWLDEWELPPGRPWQDELDKIIRTARSAAVLVGKDGLGPWEMPEMRACLSQMVKRGLPVIPVLLPDAPKAPDLPVFLAENTWVDLRDGITEDGLDRLEWGITGKKPDRKTTKPQPRGPRLHNLPYPPLGDLLKGRDEDLRSLETGQTTTITQTQAIYGLGGIGKTRLAVEYAWRSGDRYSTALFVVADSPEGLRSGLAKLAGPDLLNLPEYEPGVEANIIAAVHCWLREHDSWLMILDNVDTPEAQDAVMKELPSLSSGRVIATSRLRDWAGSIPHQEIGILSPEQAKQFLLERTAKQRSPTGRDEEDARRLAEELGGLPLALEQAAAYIVHHQMTFAAYLKAWEKERSKVLIWYKKTMEYPFSVAATWQTTLRQLGSRTTAILRLTAFLAPDPIPIEMFETGKEFVDEAIELLGSNSESDSSSIEEALAELISYSMVIREGTNFTVHRIVQEVLRSTIPEEQWKTWVELPLRIVHRFSPFDADDVRTWSVWDVLRPHASRIVDCADQEGITEPTASLMNQLGLLLFTKSLYGEAEPLMRRTLQIHEDSLGPQHPNVAIRLNNLAQLLQDTNRLAEAEPLMRRALQIDEDSLGPQHPYVARDLNNLGMLLKDTNRLAEAEPLMRRALQIDEDSFGPQHPEVATDLNNLALLLQDTNRLAEAEPLVRRALQIDEDSLGPQHPNVARDLNNLVLLLQATNRLAEAEPLMRRALQIDEDSLGPQHPNVARDLNNLARLLQATNRLAEAEPLMRRALQIDKDSFGLQHPEVAADLNNLALLLKDTSRLAEAEPMLRRSLEIRERSLGPDHPRTQLARENLAIFLQETASKVEPPSRPEGAPE